MSSTQPNTDSREPRATPFATPGIERDRAKIRCPHCGSPTRIRVSRNLSPFFRDGIVECQELLECGWRGRFGLELLATLTPSAKPNPDIHLPQSEYVLPTSPYALPRRLRGQTKNPNDPHQNQKDLFKH